MLDPASGYRRLHFQDTPGPSRKSAEGVIRSLYEQCQACGIQEAWVAWLVRSELNLVVYLSRARLVNFDEATRLDSALDIASP